MESFSASMEETRRPSRRWATAPSWPGLYDRMFTLAKRSAVVEPDGDDRGGGHRSPVGGSQLPARRRPGDRSRPSPSAASALAEPPCQVGSRGCPYRGSADRSPPASEALGSIGPRSRIQATSRLQRSAQRRVAVLVPDFVELALYVHHPEHQAKNREYRRTPLRAA